MLRRQDKKPAKPPEPNSFTTNPQQQLLKYPNEPTHRQQEDVPVILQEIDFKIERAPLDR
jgi:hypothetical protein